MHTLSKRVLLTALALVVASCVLAPSSRAESDTGPKLGLQTWTLRHMTLEQVVEFAAKNHIKYLQLTRNHLDPNAPLGETQRKLALLHRYGLVPYTFGVNATTIDKEANRKLFEFARLIGARLIVVEPALEDWDSLESLVKEYDIKLAIHNHGADSLYGDRRVVKQVLAARDSRIGVCLDVGWITEAGYDAAQVFRDYGDRVYDIHFKDKAARAEGNARTFVDTPLGSGSANYSGLFTEMRKSNWAGVMAIETDSEEFAANPQPFVTNAAAFFSKRTTGPLPQSEQEEWIPLFDGRDLGGWTPKITHHHLGENFGNTFRVENGLLKVRYDQYKGFDGQFGHLFYKTPFSYYRLRVEYRFVGEQAPNDPGAWAIRNSGAMIHSQDPRTMLRDQAFPVSIEAQFLGGLSDGKPRPTMNVCSPGTELVYQAGVYPEHCLDSSSDTFDGDQWVRAEVIALGSGLITHFVNGEKVLEYALPQYDLVPLEDADPKAMPVSRLIEGGYIALQSESHPLDIRKVELLNLVGCMDPNASNHKRYYVKSEPDSCTYAQ